MADVINWHPAFFAALELELEDYEENIQIQKEYQLSSEPLIVDVIIKKDKEIEIPKNIANIFKGYNIIEYKSPLDYLSENDFYKVIGYACLYKALDKKVNEIDIDDITITLISSNVPEALLSSRSYGLIKHCEGIYYLTKLFIPIQIIIIDELKGEENTFIRLLTDKERKHDDIIKFIKRVKIKNIKDPRYAVILDALMKYGNKKNIMEVFSMATVLSEYERELFIEIVRKNAFDVEWFAEGKIEGKEEGRLEGKAEGELNSTRKIAIKVLKKKFNDIQDVMDKINEMSDIALLEGIVDKIFEIENIEDLKKYIECDIK